MRKLELEKYLAVLRQPFFGLLSLCTRRLKKGDGGGNGEVAASTASAVACGGNSWRVSLHKRLARKSDVSICGAPVVSFSLLVCHLP